MSLRIKELQTTKEGNFFDAEGEYIPAIPKYNDHAHAKREQGKERAPRGINMWHTGFLLMIQIALLIIYGVTVSQDRYVTTNCVSTLANTAPEHAFYICECIGFTMLS